MLRLLCALQPWWCFKSFPIWPRGKLSDRSRCFRLRGRSGLLPNGWGWVDQDLHFRVRLWDLSRSVGEIRTCSVDQEVRKALSRLLVCHRPRDFNGYRHVYAFRLDLGGRGLAEYFKKVHIERTLFYIPAEREIALAILCHSQECCSQQEWRSSLHGSCASCSFSL